jgi:hypothetical protein
MFVIKHVRVAMSFMSVEERTGPKQVVSIPPSGGARQLSAERMSLLQVQSAAHAVSDVEQAVSRHVQEASPGTIGVTMVAALASNIGVQAVPVSAGVPASSGGVTAESVGVELSSTGVAGGVLEEELHPTAATPEPTSEAAAKPIKYREARIDNTLRPRRHHTP